MTTDTPRGSVDPHAAGMALFDAEGTRHLESLYLTPDVVAHRARVLDWLRPAPGERVLDVGCGPGLLAQGLAARTGAAGRVCGIDASPAMVQAARARCSHLPHAAFEAGDAQSLPFGQGVFDALVCTQVLEYVPDPALALAEFARVLRRGGRLVVMDTDWESCVWHSGDDVRMRRVLGAWDAHCPHPHLPRRLGPLLGRAGFALQRVEVLPLVNAGRRENTYSLGMMAVLARFALGEGGMAEADVRAWADEQAALSARGEYFFSLDRHVFIATRS